MLKSLALTILAIGAVQPTLAASPGAWESYAANVEATCIKATSGILGDAKATVDPFGSESYGLAIVSGESSSILCVFDKRTEAVEIGSELEVTIKPTILP